MKEKITVIKVGGAIVESPIALENLIRDFSSVEGKKLLVHGGGRSATAMASRLGIETQMVNGRRITDEGMLCVVTMVYGGLVNKDIVARMQALGVNALGLTGADMNIILSHKRPAGEVDYGWVGDVDRVDGQALKALVDNGAVPVIAPLTHDGKGHLLNTNADTMAGETAKGLAPLYDVTLVYCFEKPGVLTDPDDDNSVISLITPEIYEKLKADGTVSGGMIPKLDNAFAALRAGVSKVVITHATAIADPEAGTTIRL